MTLIRRATQLAFIAAVTALGVFLALEATEVDGDTWRANLADTTRNLFAPDRAAWQIALIGAALAIGGIILIAAQLAPARKGTSRMLEVGSNEDGATHLTGRATLRSVEHELRQIEGVTGSAAVMPTAKKIHATIRVDDRCDLADIETQAHERLDTGFWINLGVPDIAIAITVEFDPRPPRVR
ncbi:Asp23/Gls24 family envelope stress response protein [Ilumatobacter coccineus]|uniref:Alkaline shock response membrane anchor protein AmaP n=1 Tax=Ilumatobacter coccineus (strain NBRC 103263 / KCTC 29153 / YM16-304) TaxID=1313172 RepID=A0A6C7EG71_ILUCY|nr:hypothetical protein [Ilumatobacter coccineus]BAN03588.1 hypothetical protein YM304_32740 [Ilumatobacter coccineus YM16-304]